MSEIIEVVLVDHLDQETGRMEKMRAHELGLLHRAFSVFIFDENMRLLIHKRASGKYHSAGLWTNTCCSHPFPGESVESAAARRLKEEMGLETELEKLTSFVYKADMENGLTEHEFDHIFIGISGQTPQPDLNEVEDWSWKEGDFLLADIQRHPAIYTAWFRLALPMVIEKIRHKIAS